MLKYWDTYNHLFSFCLYFPTIQGYYNEDVRFLNFGTPENNEFSIWDKCKVHAVRLRSPVDKKVKVNYTLL